MKSNKNTKHNAHEPRTISIDSMKKKYIEG
jgi:hypothetical protein